MTDIGEYFVGAYLQHILGCEIVVYNVKNYSITGNASQNEIDVIGVCFKNTTTYLCEVKTHIKGFQSTGKTDRVKLIHSQFNAMQQYAIGNLPANYKREYMFWAPNRVQKKLMNALNQNYKPENIIVEKIYQKYLQELIEYAGNSTTEFDNPFIRTLQIAKWSKAI
jgi:hypothetical protein